MSACSNCSLDDGSTALDWSEMGCHYDGVEETSGNRPSDADIQDVVETQLRMSRRVGWDNGNDFRALAKGHEEMEDVHLRYYPGWKRCDFQRVVDALESAQ
jgi:hypothetical protein